MSIIILLDVNDMCTCVARFDGLIEKCIFNYFRNVSTSYGWNLPVTNMAILKALNRINIIVSTLCHV